ncbi:MAG TPA: recombinase family protein [Bacteroidota bacterium]|nr:recombinase family protein [Bacteroidota bacterium]
MQGDIKQLRIIRYRRKSTEGDERQIASLGDQANALDELIARLDIVNTQIHADVEESKSAKAPGRHQFNAEVLKPIEEGKANAIMCWHADRLSRNAIDTAALVQLMDTGKLHAVITNQQMFWNTPMDKFMLALLCGQAKLENDNKGVNVKRGLAGKIRKGWRPGRAPIGYLNSKIKEKGDRDIIIDAERFPLVRKLWDTFLTGKYSVRQVQHIAAQEIRLRTLATKKLGGKPLSLSHIYKILTDPFYYGPYWWKSDTGGYELRKGIHTPMITEEEYRLAQAILGHREKPQPKKHLFAFTQLIRCGACGSSVAAEEKWQIICGVCKKKFASQNREECPFCKTAINKMPSKKVLHYVYYHCSKKKDIHCTQNGVRIEEIENQIDQTLKRFSIKEKYMEWAIKTLQEDLKQDVSTNVLINGNKEKEKAKLKEEISELNRFIIKQENQGWTLMKKEDALIERNRLESEMNALEGRTKSALNNGFDSSSRFIDYTCHARFLFKEGTIEQKRSIFEALGSNITLKDKKLSIDFVYPLTEIRHMIEIAPEIFERFEPTNTPDTTTTIIPFSENIPALRRGMNAIRTYFMTPENQFQFSYDKDSKVVKKRQVRTPPYPGRGR